MIAGKANLRRRHVLVGVTLTAAVVTGSLLATLSSTRDTTRPVTANSDPTDSQESTDGYLVGSSELPQISFAHNEAGARDAAIAYAGASQGWLYLTDDEIREAVADVAAPEAARRLAEDVVTDVSAARPKLGASPGRVWWLVRPLGWDVEEYSEDQARVSVWTVTVLSAAEVAAPQTEWMTVSIDLAWEPDGWRVDDVRSTPGPTPMTGPNDQPWDAEPFDHALDGFTRIGEEPAR